MKVLVIDDHPLFLDGIIQVLQQLDKEVVVLQAMDVEQALKQLNVNNDITLILVDLGLPGIGGLDFLSILTEKELWIPAVVLSAQDDMQIIMQALDAGALGFIPKAFGADELLNALKRVLNGEVFLPEFMQTQVEHFRRIATKSSTDIGSKHGITPRQFRVLELLVKGYSNKNIAMTLNLSEHTVKSHLKALFIALNVDNRTACVQRAKEQGILDIS